MGTPSQRTALPLAGRARSIQAARVIPSPQAPRSASASPPPIRCEGLRRIRPAALGRHRPREKTLDWDVCRQRAGVGVFSGAARTRPPSALSSVRTESDRPGTPLMTPRRVTAPECRSTGPLQTGCARDIMPPSRTHTSRFTAAGMCRESHVCLAQTEFDRELHRGEVPRSPHCSPP